MASLGTFLLLAAFVTCSYAAVDLGRRRAAAVAPADRERHRRLLSDLRDHDRRVGGADQRVPDRRLLDQVRRPLLGQRPAAALQDHLVLGRARRLDHVLGVPAVDLRLAGGLREPRAAPRADPLRRRHDLRREHVLPVPDGDAQEPVHDVPDGGADRRRGAEPAAPELLHGDSPAIALHRLCRDDDPVRVRHRGADHRPPRRLVAARGAALDDVQLAVPVVRPDRSG